MHKRYDLGLDISTSNVGWSLLAQDESEIILGYIPLADSEGLFRKAAIIRAEIVKFRKKYDIDRIFAEEDLKRFGTGMSSAETIHKLSQFNGMVCLIVFEEFSKEPVMINVNHARKAVGCKIDKKDKTRSTKEKVFEWARQRISYDWPTKIVKSGKNKGQVVYEKGCFDMSDAYVVCKAGQTIHKI